MKWDVKHDRAKRVIDAFLDNAGDWQEREDLVEVQFYLWPMSEKEFDRLATKGRGNLIYALHRR